MGGWGELVVALAVAEEVDAGWGHVGWSLTGCFVRWVLGFRCFGSVCLYGDFFWSVGWVVLLGWLVVERLTVTICERGLCIYTHGTSFTLIAVKSAEGA